MAGGREEARNFFFLPFLLLRISLQLLQNDEDRVTVVVEVLCVRERARAGGRGTRGVFYVVEVVANSTRDVFGIF